MRTECRIEPRILQQARIEGRNTHHDGRARKGADDLSAAEGIHEEDTRTREQGSIAGNEQAVRVVERQRVEQNIPVGDAPVVN